MSKRVKSWSFACIELTTKSISSNSGINRLPPKERVFIPKTFPKSLLDVKHN